MPKASSVFICQQCGFRSSQFLGRCPECGTWNSMVEEREKVKSRVKSQESREVAGKVVNLAEVEKKHYQRTTTGIGEFDRVLGGGVVAGSLVLVSGDPGIGKSTLLTQLALNSMDPRPSVLRTSGSKDFRGDDKNGGTLYVAGEESAQQIKIRADRITPKADFKVLNEVDVDVICGVIEELKPGLVIVDSIQTLQTGDLSGVAGSVGQVRESAHRLQRMAKSLHIPIFLVGHVTKEGTVAGPRTLEHLVDVVLSLEGDSGTMFRILRANKNRFGPTDEVGIFEIVESGMVEVKNPSKLFLETKQNAPGSAVVAVLTGLRPILVEIQALVTKTSLPSPRRTGAGVDNNRLQLLVAVLQKRMGLPLFDQDIFVNVTGGLKITEPAADLAICLSIISSFRDKVVKEKTMLVGEVGLLGEVRMVREIKKRAVEARKLGFSHVISPENVKNLAQAVKLAMVEK